jgi:DNA-binding MarR family transcriptional regulator
MYFLRKQLRTQLKTVSLPQARTLAFLKRCPGASLSTLADSIGVTKATASNLVDRMVQRGMISREEDPNERRCIVLSLTGSGEKALNEANELAVIELSKVLANVPPDRLQKIYEGMTELRSVFEARK